MLISVSLRTAVGRIGDSPLAGSGGWAQNDVCAISTTGHGEQILRVNLAKHIALKLEQLYQQNDDAAIKLSNKELVDKAVDVGLDFMKERVDGYGGVICIDKVPWMLPNADLHNEANMMLIIQTFLC